VDDIVGIELRDGRMWNCACLVLMNATGSYFVSCFGGYVPPAGGAERRRVIWLSRRSVYFLMGRDSKLSGKHVLQYLDKNDTHLPLSSENSTVWHDLHREALFYALYGLSAASTLVEVTNTLEPKLDCQHAVCLGNSRVLGSKCSCQSKYQSEWSMP
jgi:hypothetical protein